MKILHIAFIVILGLVAMVFGGAKPAKQYEKEFYVFKNRGDRSNHFIPSGWMGDYGDLKYNPGYYPNATDQTNTCIKITYSGERKQGAGWAGIYWQFPANNWGDKNGGFDLSGYSEISFKIKGDKGDEYIDKFLVGGITGNGAEGDTDYAESEPIVCSTEWKTITIPLKGLNMSNVIGGFGFSVNSDMNLSPIAFYIDEIKYTK